MDEEYEEWMRKKMRNGDHFLKVCASSISSLLKPFRVMFISLSRQGCEWMDEQHSKQKGLHRFEIRAHQHPDLQQQNKTKKTKEGQGVTGRPTIISHGSGDSTHTVKGPWSDAGG